LPTIDLEVLGRLVAARAERWTARDITWTFSTPDEAACRLDAERGRVVVQLVVWATGEADLIVGDLVSGDHSTEHYEVTGEVGLIGVLDDLQSHLGAL
jgi:hypothetical protein